MNEIVLPENKNSIDAPDILTLDAFLKKCGNINESKFIAYYIEEDNTYCKEGYYYLGGQILVKKTDKLTNELLKECINKCNKSIGEFGYANSFELASINMHNSRFKTLVNSLNLYYNAV